MWTMTYSSMRHDSCINTAHPRHDLFVCVQWFIHMCDMTHTSDSARLWHTSSSCVSWLIHMCDMTHSYVWHDSFICLKCLIHMFEMPHSHVCHDSFICSAWRIHVCRDALNTGHLWHYLLVTWLDMTHSHGYHDPFIRSIWRIHMCVVTHYKRATCNIIYQWRDLTWLIHICAMTHSYLQSEEFICVSWRIQHELPVTLFVTDVIMFKLTWSCLNPKSPTSFYQNSPRSPSKSPTFPPSLFTRALHSLKTAHYSLVRAIYFLKRALYREAGGGHLSGASMNVTFWETDWSVLHATCFAETLRRPFSIFSSPG